MNKRILFLALIQIFFLPRIMFSQPCTGTTNICVPDQHVNNGSTSWHRSHGSLGFSNSNAPTPFPAGSKSLSLNSILNLGNGAFTCVKIDSAKTYRVCFWVRNASGPLGNNYGRLYVQAAKGLINTNSSMAIPSATCQMIDQSYIGPGYAFIGPDGATPWEFVTATFKANQHFSSLWFYAKNPNGPPPAGPGGYEPTYVVEVDDVRIIEEATTPPAPFVSGTNTISGCNGQTTLAINNMPPNTIATWTPAPASTNAKKDTVIVKPCVTTTYKVEIADANSTCGNCTRKVFYYTVTVNQWSEASRIVYPATTVPCKTPISLDYNSPGGCANISYRWISPQGTIFNGKTQSVIASALHTGEWTLQVINGNKNGCAEEHKFNITVGSCCVSSPNFSTVGSNPITFNSTGSGITNHVGTLWNFGDGTTSDLPNPIHTYSVIRDSTFTVCLTTLYEDGQGESCCNRICKPVTARPGTSTCMVTANFNHTPAGPANSFIFTDASSGNGTICKYTWSFGDGSVITTTIPTINHSYPHPGPWSVCLTATNCVYDEDGGFLDSCSNKKCKMIVGPKPAPEELPQPNISTARELTISPNPNPGNFSLSLPNRQGNYQVIVRDKLGRSIYDRKHELGKQPVAIMLNDVSQGVYSIEVVNGNERYVQLITITR